MISQVHDRLLSSGLASAGQIIGCTEDELRQIEFVARRILPDDYRKFMSVFGKSAGRFLNDITMFFPKVLELRTLAEEMLEEEEIKLTTDSFVFAMRNGEQFLFFEDPAENPPVKSYYWDESHFRNASTSFREMILRELDIEVMTFNQIRGTSYDL